MPAITPSLWFDMNAEEAIEFYASVFPDTEVGEMLRGPDGVAITGDFTLQGRTFNAINGGPQFPFTEAVSFIVNCADQAECDRYWDALLAGGGEPSRCGWLKDRFGLSWQIVPTEFYDLVSDPDTAQQVMDALMPMEKIDLAVLRAARDGA
ncbi:putative 3-demethylubiquinone-9 3-methyltransferase [Paraoerskovia sediminicola]|uniref:3-demethylubiquinone-9 3-methyltransferase n=1 Tax=Paraoerskovia sediminicola TaxID=1138587 RepID=A0ABN6XAG5_9CELL|nr:VOC family protein [Paraoerskovia sediminicola]BDZ41769.1 putative 3-demethylubiquinone-9 3-methyltransferase [Paraoerskovia sediminicola]